MDGTRKRRINQGIKRVKRVRQKMDLSHREELRKKISERKMHGATDKHFPSQKTNFLQKQRRHKKKGLKQDFFFFRKLFKHRFFYAGLFVLFFAFILSQHFAYAKVKLSPKTFSFHERGKKIILYRKAKNEKQLAFYLMVLSGNIDVEVEPDQEIPVEKKAEGFIDLFNNYSKEPQHIAPHTRFESVSGKVFYLMNPRGVVIPGMKNGQAGRVRVKVQAAEPGPEYNIEATDFTLPAFKEMGLSDKFYKITAVSLQKFQGGFRGTKKVLSKSKMEQVEKSLENRLQKKLLDALKREKTDRVLLVHGTESFLPEKAVFLEKEKKLSLKAKVSSLVLRKDYVESFLKHYYLSNVHPDDIFLKNFQDINFSYQGKKPLDFSRVEKVPVLMNAENTFVWKLDQEKIKNILLGQRKDALPLLLKEKAPELEKAEINIFPFWKNRVPNKPQRIFFKV